MKTITALLLGLALTLLLFGCTQNQSNPASNPLVKTQNFDDFVTAYKNATFKADYTSTATYTDGTTATSQTSIYSMGQNLKTYKKYTMYGTEGEQEFIINGSNKMVCTKSISSNWACYSPAPAVPTKTEILLKDITDTTGATISPATSETVLGEKTTCFGLDYSSDKYNVCFANDGVVLKMTSTRNPAYATASNPSSVEMIATNVSRTVTNNDFVPPATPQAAPQ